MDTFIIFFFHQKKLNSEVSGRNLTKNRIPGMEKNYSACEERRTENKIK